MWLLVTPQSHELRWVTTQRTFCTRAQVCPVYDSHVWEKWLGRKDSNLRISESKSDALPLGDAPILRVN